MLLTDLTTGIKYFRSSRLTVSAVKKTTMKINVALILAIIAAVGVVAFGFTAFQIYTERQQLNQELELKTINTAEKFYNHYFAHGESNEPDQVSISDSVINEYSFAGVAVYYPTDSLVPLNAAAAPMVAYSMD